MEFGSRALGHRSFIADPSNLKTLRKLNDLIKKKRFLDAIHPVNS